MEQEMTTWRDRVREAWKDLPEIPDGMQEAFDLGLVDGAPGYGDWLRTPYRLEDCEVDGILLAFSPPEILPRVLGQFLFQAATMCDTDEADEYAVDELCGFYSLYPGDEPMMRNLLLDQTAILTQAQCSLIVDLLKELATHAQLEHIRERAAKSIVEFWEVRCDEEGMSKRPAVPPSAVRRPLPEHWGDISLGPDDDLYHKERRSRSAYPLQLNLLLRSSMRSGPLSYLRNWKSEHPDYYGPRAIEVIVKLCRAFHEYAPDLPEFDSADPYAAKVWWEIPLELYWTERDWFGGQWIPAGLRYIPGVLVNTFALPGTAGGMDMLGCAICFFNQPDLSVLHSWRADQVESVLAYFQLFDTILDGEDDCKVVIARLELLRSAVNASRGEPCQ